MKTAKIFLILFLFFSPLVHGQASQATKGGISLDRLERYENFIMKEIEEEKIPGAVSLIIRRGEVVHQKTFGYRNITEKSPMKMDNIFAIQSMTKAIITVAFMMLHEEGHFLLTDRVSKYLPAYKNLRVIKDVETGQEGETEDLKKEVTLIQLLSHTAGFSHGLGKSKLDQEFAKLRFQPYPDIASRVEAYAGFPLVGQPGAQWYYSVGPDVISALIEHFSGMSTAEFLRKRIFEPLEMKDTGYNLTQEQQSRMVPLHTRKEGKMILADFQPKLKGNAIWSGTGGLFSTTSDYMNFCQMVMNKGEWKGKQLLSPKTMEFMTENHVGDLYPSSGVGFGLGYAVVNNIAGTKLPGTLGLLYWSGAYNTHFFIDPGEEMIAVFMTQTLPYNSFYRKKMRQLIYQAVVD